MTFITDIFRRTNIKIAFRTDNTIGNRLLRREQQTTDKYMLSGIYKLTCPIRNKAYVGQTGGNFAIRFNKHKHAFKTNSHTSKFAQHLVEHNHPFGTIQNTMQILRRHKKGPHLNTLIRFHIYAEYVNNNHINDNQTIFPNRLFDVLLNAHSNPHPLHSLSRPTPDHPNTQSVSLATPKRYSGTFFPSPETINL
jgi:hypothetical protein